jgi:hypothetical protein
MMNFIFAPSNGIAKLINILSIKQDKYCKFLIPDLNQVTTLPFKH